MDNNFNEFSANNDVRVGEDFTTSLPVYYLSLNSAFYHYFQTFRDNKDRYHFLCMDIKSWNREDIAFNFTTDYNLVFTILGFHRFVELLVKDILRNINPLLAVKFSGKEKDLFSYCDSKTEEERIEAKQINTIEYSETFRRFNRAYKHYDKTSDIYINHLKNYEFIIQQENAETLQLLSDWRNRIMHNGNKFPNILYFDYLISQRVIPIIDKIIKLENIYLGKYEPHFYQTSTGIKVIDKILEIKFSYKDFSNDKKSKELGFKLMNLAHLKEIGRVAYKQDAFTKSNNARFETSYVDPKARSERFALAENANVDFLKVKQCICCGNNSLVVYKKKFNFKLFAKEDNYIKWFKCYHCDYALIDNIGEPKYFGLTEVTLFEE